MRRPSHSTVRSAAEVGDEESRKAHLIERLESSLGVAIHQIGGARSSHYETQHGWPLLIKYACGHERTNTTTFFIGVPQNTDPRTIIAVAFGDTEEDAFLPASLVADHGEHISHDGRDWKPYVFRDAFGELILRIAPIRLDVRLGHFADPAIAREKVGFRLP